MRELSAIVPVTDEAAVIVAAFFHDAVYDVTSDDNEARSAALAERVLGELGWSDDRCSRVARLIMATAGHEPTDRRRADKADKADEAVMVDADLAVLGSEPAAYQAYVTGVRAEYGQLDDEQWRTGRRAVLRRFLDREPLYSTEPGRSRWERRARANMAAELASLDSRVLRRVTPKRSGGGELGGERALFSDDGERAPGPGSASASGEPRPRRPRQRPRWRLSRSRARTQVYGCSDQVPSQGGEMASGG